MGMSMHDRYYEPEDDPADDLDDYIADWIKFESRTGGYLDPRDNTDLFFEAVGQLQLREDLESYDECTEAEKEQILAYMLEIGEHVATESFYDNH
jgi:hypothetical protein